MAKRAFRFGVNLIPSGTKADIQDVCRQAEDLGYDIITASDQVKLELPFAGIEAWTTWSPFLALAAAAEVTNLRVGTYTLNAGLYRPALLTREVIGLQQYSGGRLELGIGVGYMKDDFESSGIPWGTAEQRIDHFEDLVREYRRLATDPVPPLMIGIAVSGRVRRFAAAEANIVSLIGARTRTAFTPAQLLDSGELTEQVSQVRTAAGERFPSIELNTLIHTVNLTEDLTVVPSVPNIGTMPEHELHRIPAVLSGTPKSIAENLHRYRETYGFTYYTVRVPNMWDFAKVIDVLR
jgi:probable F420-dependent oxidoreductase